MIEKKLELTSEVDMVDLANLSKLEERYKEMAQAREECATQRRVLKGENFATICGLESAARAYRRCADELRRVINGETPADPGMRWD